MPMELRITIEEWSGEQRIAQHSTSLTTSIDPLIVLRAATVAARSPTVVATCSIPQPPPQPATGTQARGRETLPSHEMQPTGGAPTLENGARGALTPSPAAPLQTPWAKLLDRLAGDGELFEGFTGLQPTEILGNSQVQGAVRLLDLAGCVDSFRLVLCHGPTRCIQVHKWAQNIRRSQGARSLSALIASVLEKGEPRGGSQVRRSA